MQKHIHRSENVRISLRFPALLGQGRIYSMMIESSVLEKCPTTGLRKAIQVGSERDRGKLVPN